MIKTLEWLQDRLIKGINDEGCTFIILDSVDCKNILRDINKVTVVPRDERGE